MATNQRSVARPTAMALLLTLSLLGTVFARAQGRERDFATITSEAIMPTGRGHSPRFYLPAVPAMPPRDGGVGYEWWQRRDIEPINCGAGNHSCLDVGEGGATMCCPDDRYCFMNQDMEVSCCALGNVCSDQTPCKSGDNYCMIVATTRTTVTGPPAVLSSEANATPTGSEPATTVIETFKSEPRCCNRPCGTTRFGCPKAFGGQCCPLGSRCGTSSQCLSDVTSTPPPVAHPIPEGCTATSQFACPPEEGAGCCVMGETCVGPSQCEGEPDPTVTAPDGSVIVAVDDGGLSSGAKAGIGVGVAVGATAVIAALTFCCLRRRRSAASRSRESKYTMANGVGANGGGGTGDNNGNNHHDRGGYNGNGNAGGAARASRGRFMGPLSPAAQFFHLPRGLGGGPATSGAGSEMSGPTSAGGVGSGSGVSRPPVHQNGLVYDYFGPEAVSGPYTEAGDAPGTVLPERRAGVVVGDPHGPDDIMLPVELDPSSRVVDPAAKRDGDSGGGEVVGPGRGNEKVHGLGVQYFGNGFGNGMDGNEGEATKADGDADGPFELVGSPTHESPDRARQTHASPSPPLSPAEPGEPGTLGFPGTVSPEPALERSVESPEPKP